MSSVDSSKEVPTNHPIGFWFFFWGEFAERCSYYGMRAILALYMTERLGIDKGNAGTFMSFFIAACYFFPLVGGWIADNFFGKYWTIVLFSVPYVIAQVLVGIENKYLVFATLVLLAMGSGVIKPNISTLMGMTYDAQRPGQDQLRTSAFSWFYMAINIGAFLSQTAMPRLRDAYGYQVAFIFPAVLMALALVIFAMGRRFYATESITKKIVCDPNNVPKDSKTLTGIPLHYVAVTPEEKAEDTRLKLETLGRIGALFALVMIFWAIFDQSASTWIFFANTYMDCTLFGKPTPPDSIQAFNALFIVLLVPVSVAIFKLVNIKATTKIALGFLLTGLSMVIMSYSGFMAGTAQKATRIITPEGEIVVPALALKMEEISNATSKSVKAGELEIRSESWEYNPNNKKQTVVDATIVLSDKTEIVIKGGHLASLVSGPTGGLMETILKTTAEKADIKPDATKATLDTIDWVKPNERVTVWWQVFAYFILTIGEILVSITGLELAFVAAPASMKSFVTACWLAVVFLANLLINAPITQLYPLMTPGVYFAMLAGFVAVVLVIYVPVAKRFNQGMEQNKPATT